MINCYIIAAISADGFIAKEENQISTSWTSGVDKKFFSEITKKSGVVVLGKKTYDTIGHALPNRVNIIYTNSDTQFDGAETTNKTPKELLEDLEKRGFSEVAICGGSSIYSMFLDSGLVNKLYLTVEPKIFGTGVKLFKNNTDKDIKLISSSLLSEDVLLLEYEVINQ